MSRNYTDAVIGLIVLTAAAGFLLFLYGGRHATDGRHYEVYAEFFSANGISVGADVRISGVKVGEVTTMALDPSSYLAKVQFTIDDDLDVPEDSVIAVTSDNLFSDNFLEILPGGSMDNISAGGGFQNTQDAVNILSVLGGFTSGDN